MVPTLFVFASRYFSFWMSARGQSLTSLLLLLIVALIRIQAIALPILGLAASKVLKMSQSSFGKESVRIKHWLKTNGRENHIRLLRRAQGCRQVNIHMVLRRWQNMSRTKPMKLGYDLQHQSNDRCEGLALIGTWNRGTRAMNYPQHEEQKNHRAYPLYHPRSQQ
jgi:hypothetical protein